MPGMIRPHVAWNNGVAMRDGTRLSADVFHSVVAGPRPTLLARTPYNRNTADQHRRAEEYARAGYNFVWMDVRGRGDSDGDFVPWRHEGLDGHDSIEWVAQQPWSNGEVITWGQSYLGCIQWMTALTHPPHLRAMIVYVAPSDPFEDNPTGVSIPWEVCWMRMLDGRVLQYVEGVDWPEVAWHLPLLTMDEHAGFSSLHWKSHLNHPITDSEFWDPVRYQPAITEVEVPVLHITGWYDDVQRGTMTNFSRLTAAESTRKQQSLIVGPWDHRCTRTRERTLGSIDFGPGAELDLPAVEHEWLENVLGDGGPGAAAVRIFVMGRNEWRDEQEWPLARTRWTPYLLASNGKANSRHGDGTLGRDGHLEDVAPDGAAADTFTYDPTDPVPFLSNFASSSQIGGPDDYSAVEERNDVLVYSTPALGQEVEVTGPVRLRLYASSTARDTDFTAKLLDVHPDGFSQRLCDGMVRARFRHGYREPESFVTPGEITLYDIDMWSTSHVFGVGHRIRLEVSSSAFPKYDRNLNTGASLATGTDMVTAVSSVWHDGEHPSQLVLHEIPAGD
jgi:putative CocE/NonD family hydrolase